MTQRELFRAAEDNRNPTRPSIFSSRWNKDFVQFQNQLTRDRTSRTLSLRRKPSTIPSIASVLNRGLKVLETESFPFLEPKVAIGLMRSTDVKTVRDFLKNLVIVASQFISRVENLMQDRAFSCALIEALNTNDSQMAIVVIQGMIDLFPMFPSQHEFWIDEGLCIPFSEWIGSESEELLAAAIQLIGVIAKCSGYGRDSILCCGLVSMLVETTFRKEPKVSEKICTMVCESLYEVFANRTPIDSSILSACMVDISKLLELKYQGALLAALGCLVEMTNEMPALVFVMYDMNLFPIVVTMLKDEVLVDMALPLVGNMSVSHALHVETLLQCGLFDILLTLIETQHTADVFWVMSNLVESTPSLTIGLFGRDLLDSIIDIAGSASYEVRKEGTFLLATIILFTEFRDLSYFMTGEVFSLMMKMLDSSVPLIISRCLDGILKFARAVNMKLATDELVQAIRNPNVEAALKKLLASNSYVKEEAETVLETLGSKLTE